MQIFKGFIYHLSVIFCFRNFLKNFNFFYFGFCLWVGGILPPHPLPPLAGRVLPPGVSNENRN